MQFWRPIISPVCPLVPGSCRAERLAARVRFASGGAPLKRFNLSPETCAALQRAYQAHREEWRMAHPPGDGKPAFTRSAVSLSLFDYAA
jgi:hypothetical protein